MSLVVDYSWGRPPVAALRAAGVIAASRYLCIVDDSTDGKQLTRAEADMLKAGGLDVVSNWQQHGTWEEFSGGAATGRHHTVAALRDHVACGGPVGRPIYFTCDFNPTDEQLPVIGDYYRGVASVIGLDLTGAAGGYRLIKYLFDEGLIRWGWQFYAWSTFRDTPAGPAYLHWDLRAQLRQVLNLQRIGGAAVDLDEPAAADFGQWGGAPTMTSAPADLLEVQQYCHDQTGQPLNDLGIIHATPQGGGYHEGEDLLIAQNRAPGPYPYSDYSYADARAVATDGRGRDLYPSGRLAGGNYASAFDLGGGFSRFLEFNAWMLARLQAGDPRTRDIRSMIYTPDGKVVRRFDRTGRQPDSGSSTHLGHTHFSLYRDSLGRRAGDDNLLGLLKEFFEGDAMTTQAEVYAANADAHTWAWNQLQSTYSVPFPGDDPNAKAAVYDNPAAQMLSRLEAAAAADERRDGVTLAAVQALTSGGTSVDTAAVLGAIQAAKQEETAAMQALQAQNATLSAAVASLSKELAAYRHAEAQAARAQADTLEPPAQG